ncbi:MAG TPA: hypothetical protein DCY91_15950 [Cyanobacteria bacterium UBA11370]|nr:hypothetical protein [Cyanobacteria bacterium UBA11370]HBY81828.1 hypothetical protein [Cyanobacteria bacterium UBA11148]
MSINGGETNQNNHELSEITSPPKGRKLTTHARESLPRHGFTEPFSLVDEIIDNYTRSSTQREGSTVYIQQAEKPNPLAPFPTREGGTGNLAPLSS